MIAHLRGTKQGCGVGSCGACTVVLSYHDWWQSKIEYVAINACLVPVCSLHGMAVTTIEGIGSTQTKLHPCQVSPADSFVRDINLIHRRGLRRLMALSVDSALRDL